MSIVTVIIGSSESINGIKKGDISSRELFMAWINATINHTNTDILAINTKIGSCCNGTKITIGTKKLSSNNKILCYAKHTRGASKSLSLTHSHSCVKPLNKSKFLMQFKRANGILSSDNMRLVLSSSSKSNDNINNITCCHASHAGLQPIRQLIAILVS